MDVKVLGPGGDSWVRGLRYGVWKTLWPYLAVMFNINIVLGMAGIVSKLQSLGVECLIGIIAVVANAAMLIVWRKAARDVRSGVMGLNKAAQRSYSAFRGYLFLVGLMGLLLQAFARL